MPRKPRKPPPVTRTLLSPTLFSHLPDGVQQELQRGAPSRVVPRGALVQQAGDTGNGFWLIETGAVQIGQLRSDGGFRVVATLGPGDSYGELSLLAHQPRVVDAIARSPARLRWIDGPPFEKAIMQDPVALRAMTAFMAAALMESIGYVAGFRSGSAFERICTVIANLVRHADPSGDLSVTQEELAQLAGVTRATVASALSRLERDGAIERRYGSIRVIKVRILEAILA